MSNGQPIVYKAYKSDEEKAKVYTTRLASAERDFDRWRSQAQGWFSRYENAPRRDTTSAKGLQVNVTTGVAVIDSLFSGLTAIDVEFTCEATAHATPEQGMLAETALNQEWGFCHVDEERDFAIKDALIGSIGWVKVAYDFFAEKRMHDRPIADIKADVVALIDEAQAAGLGAPDPEQIKQLIPDQEEIEEALRDRIVVDYVPWDSIRWDPTARRIKDVRWIAQITKMPMDDVKKNPLWREYAKRTRHGLRRLEDVSPDSSIDRELIVGSSPNRDEGRVTVVEMWDLETGTVCTQVKGQPWLLHESVNPYALSPDLQDRSPFVPLVLRSTTRRLRGISDMEVMERSLNEKNLYRSRTATYIERSTPKVIGHEDALTEEGLKALGSPEMNAYVSVSRESAPQDIVPMNPPALPEQVFNMSDRIDDEIREATGVNELMRGLFPDRKRTATETSEVVSASAARQSEKRNTLERFHVEIAKRMLQLMQQFYDQPRMARFVDNTLGNTSWEFTGADIIGDFDLRVSLQPREAPTRDALRQEATVGLNVLGPMAEPGPDGSSVIDKKTLAAWFMRKYGFSPRDINELLNSEAEQKKQTQEMLGVQAAGAATAAAGAPQGDVGALQSAAVPPDIAAGAVGGIGPGTPEAVRQVSESSGVRTG